MTDKSIKSNDIPSSGKMPAWHGGRLRFPIDVSELLTRPFDPVQHNRDLFDEIQIAGNTPEILSKKIEGFVLDKYFLNFLADISAEAANRFYNSVHDKQQLFDSSLPTETRLALSKDFAKIFVETANKHLAAQAEDPAHFEDFMKMPEISTFDKDCDDEGRIVRGECLISFDFSAPPGTSGIRYRVNMNVNDKLMLYTLPCTQIATMAHELAHVLDERLRAGAVRYGIPDKLAYSVKTTFSRPTLPAGSNYNTYRASIPEQHARLVENVTLRNILELARPDLRPAIDAFTKAITPVRESIRNIMNRAQPPTAPETVPTPSLTSITNTFWAEKPSTIPYDSIPMPVAPVPVQLRPF